MKLLTAPNRMQHSDSGEEGYESYDTDRADDGGSSFKSKGKVGHVPDAEQAEGRRCERP